MYTLDQLQEILSQELILKEAYLATSSIDYVSFKPYARPFQLDNIQKSIVEVSMEVSFLKEAVDFLKEGGDPAEVAKNLQAIGMDSFIRYPGQSLH